MWAAAQKTLFDSSAVGFGLLIAFAVAVLSCGNGTMPPMSARHSDSTACSGMLTHTFALAHKDLGVTQSLALILAALLQLVVWSVLLFRLITAQDRLVRILLRARSKLLRLHDHILQQFSAGILHPQIY